MSKRYFKRIDQVLIPCVVLCFTVVYVFLTKQIFWSHKLVIPNERDNVWEAILKSPEIIKMFQVIIFYSVPIFVFMLFLSLLFSKMHRLSISLGNCKLDLDQQSEFTSSAVVEENCIDSCEYLQEVLTGHQSPVGDESEEDLVNRLKTDFFRSIDQYRYQLKLVNEFGYLINTEEVDFFKVFIYFLSFLQDIFCPQVYAYSIQLYYGFYLVIEDEITVYDLDGMNLADTLKIREFLAELRIMKKPGLLHDLEKHYPKIIPQSKNDVIHSILGAPILLTNSEVFGIAIVCTKEEAEVFNQIDLCILSLLCQFFSMGLARMSFEDVVLGIISLKGENMIA